MDIQELKRVNSVIAEKCPYLVDGQTKRMHGGMPVPLKQEQFRAIKDMPHTVAEWVRTSIDIYRESLTSPDLFWVRDLIETGSSPETIQWSRAFTESERVINPAFARPDMSQWNKIVELQIPGSGYGLISIFNPELIQETKSVYSRISGSAATSWLYLYFNKSMIRDTQFLVEQVGMDLSLGKIPNDWKKYRLIRRQFLHQLVEIPQGTEILAAALQGDIIIDPSPCLLFDQKVMLAFPFHRQLACRYPDSVREMLPATALLEKDRHGHPLPMRFDQQILSAQEIISMSSASRDFVLKYAGTDPFLRFGGHGVFKLKGDTHVRSEKYMEQAFQSGQPWILQRGCWEKHPAVFLNGTDELHHAQDYFSLWRPVYSLYPEPKLVSLVLYQSPNWKVHGTAESLITVPHIID